MKWILALALITNFSYSYACDMNGNTGIVEKNDLYIGVSDKSVNSMTETQFDSVITKVEKFFADFVIEKGGELKVVRNWTDGTVNAFAKRTGTNKEVWEVHMYGGLARHETITADGFALVVCHELGHHLGGAPRKADWQGNLRWASNEGNSDYWGTTKCLRKVWDKENNINVISKIKVPATVEKLCNAKWSNKADAALCMRTALAGQSLANLFSSLRSQPALPKFDTPDPAVVTKTYDSHPLPQCRMDTYFRASLCKREFYTEVSMDDPNVGMCNRDAGETDTARPLCWYAPSDFKDTEE